MIKDLIKLADHLDKKGLHKEADYLDKIIKISNELPNYSKLNKDYSDNKKMLEESVSALLKQISDRKTNLKTQSIMAMMAIDPYLGTSSRLDTQQAMDFSVLKHLVIMAYKDPESISNFRDSKFLKDEIYRYAKLTSDSISEEIDNYKKGVEYSIDALAGYNEIFDKSKEYLEGVNISGYTLEDVYKDLKK